MGDRVGRGVASDREKTREEEKEINYEKKLGWGGG